MISNARNRYEREGQEVKTQGAGGFGPGAKQFSESTPRSMLSAFYPPKL